MRFRRVGAQPQSCLYRVVCEGNALRGWIEIEKEQQIVRARCITIRGDEVRISFDRFIKRLQRLEQRRPHVCRVNVAVDDCLGLKIKFERDQILRGTFFHFRLLFRRKFRLELSDDRLRQVTLDCKQVRRGAIVCLRPNVSVGARVYQRRIDTKTIAGALHRTFHDVSDAELPPNFAQIAFGPGLVLAHACVADDFQVGDLRQIGKDLVLDSVSEVSVVLVFTQALERQDCY